MNEIASINAPVATKKSERNYGIDLLRLVAMLMVVILHVLGNIDELFIASPLVLKNEVFWIVQVFCYCAVNVYAIISGYVGLKSKHRYSSLIYLCLQLIFYSVVITGVEIVLMLINGESVSLLMVAKHLLPSVHTHWYFSAYFCLFFFMPMLNHIVINIPRNTLKITGVFVFIVFCCWTQIHTNVAQLDNGYSVLWLAILYVLGAYFAKYEVLAKLSVIKSVIGYIVCVALSMAVRIALANIFAIKMNLLISYTSPTIVFSAVFLINIFSKMKFSAVGKKIVASTAPLSFGIYLIHCHPAIMERMANDFDWIINEPLYYGLFLALGFALIIFVSCLIIDWFRLLLFNLFNIKGLSIKIEGLLAKIFKKSLKILHISFD